MSVFKRSTPILALHSEEHILVDPVGDGIPKDGQPVEDHRGFASVFGERLVQHIHHHRKRHKCDEQGPTHNTETALADQVGEGSLTDSKISMLLVGDTRLGESLGEEGEVEADAKIYLYSNCSIWTWAASFRAYGSEC